MSFGTIPPFLLGKAADTHNQPPPDNDLLLVERVDIFIAALVGFLALLRIPRLLARLWKWSEWSEGHFLRFKVGNRWALSSPSANNANPIKKSRSDKPEFAMTCESDSCCNQTDQQHFRVSTLEHPRITYSPHIPAFPAFLRPVAEYLRLSIIPGYSNSQVSVMLVYLGILLFALFYRSDFFKNPKRPGLVAASQLPFVFAFAAKNNVPGSLLGIGYQHLNYFHRYAGRLVVLAVNVHAVGNVYRWATLGTNISLSLRRPSNIWGLVALACMNIIFVFSIPVLRARAYNLFRITHLVGYLLVVPALYLHHPTTLPFIIAISAVYLLDVVLCLLKTRIVTAKIRPLSTLSATCVEISSLNYGWRAGQHVRIRVLSLSLGWFSWTEPHPFTIASAPVTSEGGHAMEGLVLICKKAGGWTGRLFDMAKASQSTESGVRGTSRTIRILIEGPYGGPGHAMFDSYSAVVTIIGGSGITFALPIIQDLVQKGLRGEGRAKVIKLVWIVQNSDATTPLLPVLASLVNSCPYLTISVHYTRTSSIEVKDCDYSSTFSPSRIPEQVSIGHQITMYPGRPGQRYLVSVMENAIAQATRNLREASGTLSNRNPSGMLVGVCGPPGMSTDVVAAVSGIRSKMKARIGGVEMHQETFKF